MLRMIGSGMILAGCLGLGLWYRGQMSGRIRALRQLTGILELLSSEVRYGRATLPECCRRVKEQVPEEFAAGFCRIEESMQENEGSSFARVFRESMADPLRALPLKEVDREAFLGAVPKAGFVDGQMQLRLMETSSRQLSRTMEELERENTEKCRMAVGLGALGGLFLLLILM